MTARVLVLLAPVVLVGLAALLVDLRTRYGGCPAHRRYAWLRAAPRSRSPFRSMSATPAPAGRLWFDEGE